MHAECVIHNDVPLTCDSRAKPTGAIAIARDKTDVTLKERLIRGKSSQCLVVTSPDGRTLYVSPEGDVDEWMRAISLLEPPPNAAELRRNTIGERPVVSADFSEPETGVDRSSCDEGDDDDDDDEGKSYFGYMHLRCVCSRSNHTRNSHKSYIFYTV